MAAAPVTRGSFWILVAYVPFEARWADGVWVAGLAIAISVLATLYPAHAATQVAPAEALRYE